MKIDLVAAARPNFMKIAPIYKVLCAQNWCRPRIIHTGQHYDDKMSDWFFRDLGLPSPYVNLGVGSGTHAEQTGRVMMAYESFCMADKPDWTIVVGDVNSTFASAFAARKLGIPVAHLEAGLRSGDRSMPEELNRVATDAIADVLWTPSSDADENLRREGIPEARVKLVGNVMIDTYELLKPSISKRNFAFELGLGKGKFGVVTLHRPSNVDRREDLLRLISMLERIARKVELVFPVHPRTRQRMEGCGISPGVLKNVNLIEPVGYIDFMSLVSECTFALTDSGGIQEETTYLGIPCLTLRENTERPITVTLGTNELVDDESVFPAIERILGGRGKRGSVPPFWDGQTAIRIGEHLRQINDRGETARKSRDDRGPDKG